ncbi:MAG: DUF2238 domain-containing protein [Alphaproteobacteria bacterium]|nr:DUF2238 domain-containing protein [Alphaproteobacteria bacterium]
MITTARSAGIPHDFHSNRLLQGVAVLYGVFWLALAVMPLHRPDWLLENILIFITVPSLVLTYRRFAFSELSYVLIAVFLALHAVGSHYTYSETPLGFWMSEAWGWERNHYDRVIHFAFGVLIAYPFREIFLRAAKIPTGWANFLAFCMVATFSACYEIIEWWAASIVDPEAAMAFLGTQGDVFDAQKDSTLAMLGALLTMAAAAMWERHRSKAKRRR